MTNSIDRDQWLNVTSESRDRIWPFLFLFFLFFKFFNFALGGNRTHDPRVPEPKRTPLGYTLPEKFVTQSRTGLQIYEGHDDQLNRPGPMA
jgi:hypothetical protein